MARAWRGGVLGAMFCAACVSTAWAAVNVEGVPFDDAARVAGRETAFTRGRVEQIVCDFIKQGYWVEVFDDESGELLAGPFDPDARARVAVAF